MNDLPRIAATFAQCFRAWNLTLPKTALKRRKRGTIRKRGWLIQYCFGRDERGEYLDYYGAYRWQSEPHVRIRQDGSIEDLPTMSEFMFFKEGDDMKKVEEEFYAENQAIAQLLFEKGFTLFTVNMALRSGPVGQKEPEGAEGEPEKQQ